MRALGRVILWLLAIILIVAVLTVVFLSHVIKSSFNTAAPAFLGVSAHVEKVHARLFQGRLVLEGLVIGNPEGFNTPHMIQMSKMAFEVEPRSLFTDRIRIREVTVEGFHLTLEQGLLHNNLLTLVNNLSGGEKAEKPAAKPDAETEKAKDAKKDVRVEIDTVDITDTRLNVAMTAMAGKSVPVPLPPIHLKDIGKDKEGASIMDAIMAVLNGILQAATGAVSGAGDLISGAFGMGADAVKAIGSSVGGAITNLSASAVDAASSVKDIAGSAVDSITGAAGGLVSSLSGHADETADAKADAKAGLKEAEKSAKEALDAQKEELSKAADDAKANLKDTEKALKETWNEKKDDLSDTVSGAKESLGQLKTLFK